MSRHSQHIAAGPHANSAAGATSRTGGPMSASRAGAGKKTNDSADAGRTDRPPAPRAKEASAKPRPRPVALSLHIGLNARQCRRLRRLDRTAGRLRVRRQRHGGGRQRQRHEADRAAGKKATRANVLRCAAQRGQEPAAGRPFFPHLLRAMAARCPTSTATRTTSATRPGACYDGQLIDDELYLELSRFGAGVRILVLSDSCHSGTVARAPQRAARAARRRSAPS